MDFDIQSKLSPKVTICMKCQNLYAGENIINLLSAKFIQRAEKVNLYGILTCEHFYIDYPTASVKSTYVC